MRAYPVTSNELWGLGALGVAASVLFSIAAASIMFAIDTAEAIDLSPGVPEETLAFWKAAKSFAAIGGAVMLIAAIAAVAGGSLYILHILRRTTFDE